MRRVRRPTASAGSPPPDPRAGRARVRLSLRLPALGLLLGALTLFVGAPVWAQIPVVQFPSGDGTPGGAVRTYGVFEGGQTTFRLVVSPAPTSDITVTLGHTAGTATAATGNTCEAGADYVPLASVAVAAGQTTSALITLRPCHDRVADEVNEQFTLTIVSGTGYTAGTRSSTTVTIRDGTFKVSLGASPDPVAEGSPVTVTAWRSRQGPPVNIPLTLTAGTAESGDFGTLTSISMAAGATSGTGTVATNADTDTDDETFTVALNTASLPTGHAAGITTSVEVTITDDDESVTLLASPNPVAEGSDVTVTATVSKAPAAAVTIPVTLTPGTAESGDYGALTSITVAAGATTGTGTISANHDPDTDDETFTVALGSSLPSPFLAGDPSSVEVRITDDDESVKLSASPNPVDEGSTVTVTATLSEAQTADVTIPVTLTRGTAESGDYGTLASITVTTGSTTGTGTISTTQDADDDDETFTVALGSSLPSPFLPGSPSSVVVTITDIPLPTVSLHYAQWQVAEGSTATFTARLSEPAPDAGVPLRVEVASARRTSETGDHEEGPFDIDFGAGETSKNVQVATHHDTDADDETFRVEIATTDQELATAGYQRGTLTLADFTILDDEARPKVTLSVTPNPVPEGQTVTVTATLSEALTEDLRVQINQSRGTADVDDYEHFSSVTIPAGRTTGTGTFRANHDADPDDETFTVALAHVPPALASAGDPSSVEVMIKDDDTTEVTLEAEHTSVPEGQTNYITLRFSEPVPLDRGILHGDPKVTVWVRVTDTETGALLARVPVVVKGNMTEPGFHVANDVDEDGDDESVTVTLETDNLPTWMTVGEPSSVTYTVDDAQEATVSLSVSPARVAEGSSTTVTATLSNALSDHRSELHVPVELTPGTAEDGDFWTQVRYIEVPAGATTGTIEVEAREDGDTDDETFTVSLRAQRAQVAKGEPSSVTVTIVDDDEETPVELSVSDAVAEETSQPPSLIFAVTLNRAVDYQVAVEYRTVDGTATGGVDYVKQTGLALIFEPGETRKEIRVPVIDDNEEDSGETFTLELSNPKGADLADAEGIGTILNDDPKSTDADVRWLLVQGASNGAGPWTKLDIGTVDADTTQYVVTVPHAMTVGRILATPMHEKATYRSGAGGELRAARAGFYSRGYALSEGDNTFAAEVTAQDGTTTKTYTVTVTREARALSSNAKLSGLTAEAGADGNWSALDMGAFAANTTSYRASVPHVATHARLTATAADSNATLTGGGSVALDAGANALSVEVTAEDGVTTKTYTVTVDRALPAPLTAAFEGVPAEHDAQSAFTVDVRFSEALDTGPTAGAFDVAFGNAKAVELVEAGLYRVSVKPKSWRDTKLTLAGGRACGAGGGVCTADGRALENTVEASVGGPVRIRIEGGKAREGKDPGIDFQVTLNRPSTEAVSVDYATADGTAKAGEDYDAVSGALSFAAGETEKTLHVPVLDDEVDEGSENFFMHLSNASGAHLRSMHKKASGTIRNTDLIPGALLARFGRATAEQVVTHIEERMAAPRRRGFRARFAGQELQPGQERDFALGLVSQLSRPTGMGPAGGVPMAMGSHRAGAGATGMTGTGGMLGAMGATGTGMAGMSRMPSATGMGGMQGAMGMTGQHAPMGGYGPGGGAHGDGLPGSMGTGGSLFSSSEFELNRESSGGILSLWSRSSRSHFSGLENALSLNGDVRTTMVGADYSRGALTVGLSVGRTLGLGSYQGTSGGQMTTSMTGLYPWVGYQVNDRVSVWGTTGYGTGTLSLTPDAARALETGVSMRMSAVGTRGELVGSGATGGFSLAFKADALYVTAASDLLESEAGRLNASEAGVSRVRTALEGSRGFSLGGGRLSLTPSVEVGLRQDGGDAETGAGMDVGGGLAFTDTVTGLSLDVRVRTLVMHQADGFSERGMSLSFGWDPTPSSPLGLTAKVAPSWGGESRGGAESLWGNQMAYGMSSHQMHAAGGRVAAEVGYGVPVGARFVGTPSVGLSTTEYGREYQVGYGLGGLGRGGVNFQLGVDAQRQEMPLQGGASNGVVGRATLAW